jgi:putative IMPACT (imprinted ancient) family translation regulator
LLSWDLLHRGGQQHAVVSELYEDARVARATHNMRAWRFCDERTGRLVADNDDDGEDAAGGRMALLLEAMRAENVLVVVTRWYGGVQLGPLRFKVINDVARALVEGQPWYAGRGAKR